LFLGFALWGHRREEKQQTGKASDERAERHQIETDVEAFARRLGGAGLHGKKKSHREAADKHQPRAGRDKD
jgi:hypothetical protein